MTLTKETLRTSLLPKVRQSLQSFKSIIYKGKVDLFRRIEIQGQTPKQSNPMDQWDFQKVKSASPMFVEKGLMQSY